ncbi:hypothetical protein G6K93_31920 [Agrobacterium rhizogenes]|uniref:hypothetical protein n=1 Tax=Rhizobium rhizogenes TaxID=359 RepID=UPI001572BC1A|nr:hypothetical protein [Rhizobium rhizogenes]NTF52990.1 hypothetical protein [Rhizobium rhizogenes]NTF65927.1 hypothetical protein [Rhizobium rhizogenes]NTG05149.1 hypothetical protein [Rhizobium rhizogenes]NTG18443.1 hypothetical protein [Rhizobium rhizogenes]NTG25247.1 hypothetical protein [Rhizobium rhizogenes]
MDIQAGWLRLIGAVVAVTAVLSTTPAQAAETPGVWKAASSFAFSLVDAGAEFGTFDKNRPWEISTLEPCSPHSLSGVLVVVMFLPALRPRCDETFAEESS